MARGGLAHAAATKVIDVETTTVRDIIRPDDGFLHLLRPMTARPQSNCKSLSIADFAALCRMNRRQSVESAAISP